MKKTWKAAIIKVLSEADGPLHFTEITDQILTRGYYQTDGATPAATVNAQLTASIKKDRERSPFTKIGRGIFALKESQTAEKRDHKPGMSGNDEPDESSDSIIHSFGMYWQRDLVVWRADPKIFGKQQSLSKPVDMGPQKGIYILYDHHTVVYVGRSIDRPLGKRLYEHTLDRLGSRWNRFSWFGLLDATPQGSLKEHAITPTVLTLIATLESLLIETLEPPQNRRRGDNFSAIEYIQAIDPELKERELQQTLRHLEEKLRFSENRPA